MAYVQLSDVRAHAGFKADDTSDDTRLSNLIPQAQQAIDDWTHTTFEISSDATKYFDAVHDVDDLTLYLTGVARLEQLASITSITNGDATTVTSGQYVTEPRNGTPYHAITLKSSANITWTYTNDSENAIEIVGKWVYSETPPDAIKLACIQLVLHWYRMDDMSEVKVIPDDICMLLKPYKVIL